MQGHSHSEEKSGKFARNTPKIRRKKQGKIRKIWLKTKNLNENKEITQTTS